MDREQVLRKLKSLSDPRSIEGKARYGIVTERAYGVSVPNLRAMAKEIGRDHALAQELWWTRVHEAMILASMIDDPRLVTADQMERWVRDLYSWDLCDQCCGNLFDKTPFALQKAVEWSGRDEEFVKRAGFSLIAWTAFHNKGVTDEDLAKFLPIIEGQATDERNYVKKAVNWALRQIGKRNPNLNSLAIRTAKKIMKADSRAARWIASDALKELTGDAVQKRFSRG